jgi:SAM-dependent methyltransferase
MAPRWKQWWQRFGPASQPVSDHLVKIAQVGPGARVLDLATGMGEPALTFAQAVGPSGYVLGIDQATQMIEIARAHTAGYPQIHFAVQDIEQLVLLDEPPFDVLVARWGLMFCHDLVSTLKRVQPLLKPGGKFVAAVWSTPAQVPILALAAQVMKDTLAIDLKRPGPGPHDLADPAQLADAFAQAGYRQISWEYVPVQLACASAQAYLHERCLTSEVLETTLKGLSAPDRERYDQALERAIAPWQTSNGLVLVNQALCLSAQV